MRAKVSGFRERWTTGSTNLGHFVRNSFCEKLGLIRMFKVEKDFDQRIETRWGGLFIWFQKIFSGKRASVKSFERENLTAEAQIVLAQLRSRRSR